MIGASDAFRFTVQHVFFIKPPVDRIMLVGVVEAGTVRPGMRALLHSGGRAIPFTVEGIELLARGDTPAANVGEQVALRCVGLAREHAVAGMRVTAVESS